jgi:hypothetical protein
MNSTVFNNQNHNVDLNIIEKYLDLELFINSNDFKSIFDKLFCNRNLYQLERNKNNVINFS